MSDELTENEIVDIYIRECADALATGTDRPFIGSAAVSEEELFELLTKTEAEGGLELSGSDAFLIIEAAKILRNDRLNAPKPTKMFTRVM